jgi:hypothetical protein
MRLARASYSKAHVFHVLNTEVIRRHFPLLRDAFINTSTGGCGKCSGSLEALYRKSQRELDAERLKAFHQESFFLEIFADYARPGGWRR